MSYRKNLIAVIVISVVAVGCYVNSLGSGFTFDDGDMIKNNLLIRSLGNVGKIFTTSWWWGGAHKQSHEYRPLTVLSFALNYRINQLRPFGYHLANVFLHTAASVLFFLFLKTWRGEHRLSLIAALLFASHPVHTEAVNNIVGRAEILAAIFVFAGFLLFVYAIKTRRAWQIALCLIGSALCFFLGLLSKEMAIAFLPGALLIALLDFLAPPKNAHYARHLWCVCLWAFAGFMVVLGTYILLRKNAIGGFVASSMRISPLDNVLVLAIQRGDTLAYYATVIKALGIYLHLLIAPIDLTADYSYNEVPLASGLFQMAVLTSFLALAGLVILAFILVRARKITPAFGIFLFFASIAPVSNAFKVIGTLIGERLLYLPSAGFCILLAWGLIAAAKWLARKRHPQNVEIRQNRILTVICVIIISAYGVRCILRNPDWRDDLTLFSKTASTSPNSARISSNFGNLLIERGAYDYAIRRFERALEIAPFYGVPLAGKGEALRRLGKPEESILLQKKIIKMEPDYYAAHYYLAEALADLGKKTHRVALFKRATEEYLIAARLKPSIPAPYLRLGELYLDYNKRLELAEGYFKKAYELAPESPLALIGLGRVYSRRGENPKARECFLHAAKLAPVAPSPWYRLALVAIKEKRYAEAERHFLKVLKLAPEDPASYLNLANLYHHSLGKPQAAIKYYEKALELNPHHPRLAEIQTALQRLRHTSHH